ncbi:hypothetical protein DFJ74DRAFT_697740 [Hyaloraphidium curvatum]|nr:hypothetical protein DFJ74DRAFT_697740 [Hyaloraphidium curvatum]
MTADCNGPNSGSVLWRASPAALLLLRAAWGAYGAGVPGLVIPEAKKGADDDDAMDIYAGRSALLGRLHLLDEGCRPNVTNGVSIQRLLANLTLPCLQSFHFHLSATEGPAASRDPGVPPLPALSLHVPLYHEQASLRHALSALLPAAYSDRALFLPQHAINAYPPSLHAACPPHRGPPIPGRPEPGRGWQRGDLLAHYPSCKYRRMEDGLPQGGWDGVRDVLKGVTGAKEAMGDACREWVVTWAARYGGDGLDMDADGGRER